MSPTAHLYPPPHTPYSLQLAPDHVYHSTYPVTGHTRTMGHPDTTGHTSHQSTSSTDTSYDVHQPYIPSLTNHPGHPHVSTLHTNDLSIHSATRHTHHTPQHTSQPTHGLYTPPTLCHAPTLVYLPSMTQGAQHRPHPTPHPPTPPSFPLYPGKEHTSGIHTYIHTYIYHHLRGRKPSNTGDRGQWSEHL